MSYSQTSIQQRLWTEFHFDHVTGRLYPRLFPSWPKPRTTAGSGCNSSTGTQINNRPPVTAELTTGSSAQPRIRSALLSEHQSRRQSVVPGCPNSSSSTRKNALFTHFKAFQAVVAKLVCCELFGRRVQATTGCRRVRVHWTVHWAAPPQKGYRTRLLVVVMATRSNLPS